MSRFQLTHVALREIPSELRSDRGTSNGHFRNRLFTLPVELTFVKCAFRQTKTINNLSQRKQTNALFLRHCDVLFFSFWYDFHGANQQECFIQHLSMQSIIYTRFFPFFKRRDREDSKCQALIFFLNSNFIYPFTQNIKQNVVFFFSIFQPAFLKQPVRQQVVVHIFSLSGVHLQVDIHIFLAPKEKILKWCTHISGCTHFCFFGEHE